MRYQIFLPAVAFLCAVGACTDQSTSPTAVKGVEPLLLATAATRTEFEGFVHFCEARAPDGLRITPGGTLHIKGARNRNQWVTGHPLVDGVEENVLEEFNLNLKTGHGFAHVVMTLRPDAVDGTWEIRTTVEVSGGVAAGSRGVGHGTGELHGMTIKFTTGPSTTAEDVCNPDLDVASLNGIIISSATSD